MKIGEEDREKTAGIAYTVLAYAVWGLLPLYWKYLDRVSAFEILAHRIFWSFVFVMILLLLYRRWQPFKEALCNIKIALPAFLASLLISANWFIYIWAVNNGHVIESSLGYYINPLLSVALGVLVLKERLTRWQKLALGLASIGVVILIVQYGKVPWIAFSLAITFGLYGLVKKRAQTEAMVGLALETFFVAPLACIYIAFMESKGVGAISSVSTLEITLLMGAGIVTALPLLWFAKGARIVPLSTIGFIQYLSPTITLVIGVFIFKEAFTSVHTISFAFIWCALLLYSLSYTNIGHQLSQQQDKV